MPRSTLRPGLGLKSLIKKLNLVYNLSSVTTKPEEVDQKPNITDLENGDFGLKEIIAYLDEDNELSTNTINELTHIESNIEQTKSIFPSSIKYFLPSKRREEILGDLHETVGLMLKDELPRWQIRLFLFWQLILILIGLFRSQLTDFGPSKYRNR